jgi:hypothetical protein
MVQAKRTSMIDLPGSYIKHADAVFIKERISCSVDAETL